LLRVKYRNSIELRFTQLTQINYYTLLNRKVRGNPRCYFKCPMGVLSAVFYQLVVFELGLRLTF